MRVVMKFFKKTGVALFFVFISVMIFGTYNYLASAQPNDQELQQTVQLNRCPEGSYEIGERDGEAICKLEPTGCPYGDSIPLGPDCDKAKANQEPTPVITPDDPQYFVGK